MRWLYFLCSLLFLGHPAFAISDAEFEAIKAAHQLSFQTLPTVVKERTLIQVPEKDRHTGMPALHYLRLEEIAGYALGSSDISQNLYLVLDETELLDHDRENGSLSPFFEQHPRTTLLLNLSHAKISDQRRGMLPSSLQHLWLTNVAGDITSLSTPFKLSCCLNTIQVSDFPNLTSFEGCFLNCVYGLGTLLIHTLPKLEVIKYGFFQDCPNMVSLILGGLPQLRLVEDNFFKCGALSHQSCPLAFVRFIAPPTQEITALLFNALRRSNILMAGVSLLSTSDSVTRENVDAASMLEFHVPKYQALSSNFYWQNNREHLLNLCLFGADLFNSLARVYLGVRQRLSASQQGVFNNQIMPMISKAWEMSDPVSSPQNQEVPQMWPLEEEQKFSWQRYGLFAQVTLLQFNIMMAEQTLRECADTPVGRKHQLCFLRAFINAFAYPRATYQTLSTLFQVKSRLERIVWGIMSEFRWRAFDTYVAPKTKKQAARRYRMFYKTLGFPYDANIEITSKRDIPLKDWQKSAASFFGAHFTFEKLVDHVHSVLQSEDSPLDPLDVRYLLRQQEEQNGCGNGLLAPCAGSDHVLAPYFKAHAGVEAGEVFDCLDSPITRGEVHYLLDLLLNAP